VSCVGLARAGAGTPTRRALSFRPESPTVNGSDPEPQVPLPQDAAEQMREATERLREQAWMFAPVTSPVPEQPDRIDADHV